MATLDKTIAAAQEGIGKVHAHESEPLKCVVYCDLVSVKEGLKIKSWNIDGMVSGIKISLEEAGMWTAARQIERGIEIIGVEQGREEKTLANMVFGVEETDLYAELAGVRSQYLFHAATAEDGAPTEEMMNELVAKKPADSFESSNRHLRVSRMFLSEWKRRGNQIVAAPVDPDDSFLAKFSEKALAPAMLVDKDETGQMWVDLRDEDTLNQLLDRGGRTGWSAALKEALGDLPAEYDALRDSLGKMSEVFRVSLAEKLEPALNARAATMPQETYEDKKTLAKWINAELRRLGLAIKDPKTGKPCHLVGDSGNKPGIGRFMLNYTEDAGKLVHTVTSVTLPPLTLMPDDLSRAPYGERGGKVRR
jgi:hypothetical protein